MRVADYTVDVVVVGGGVMGCAAAYHLAADGRRVALVEQFALGHARGSSHGPSRIIRLTYEGADYVQLARAAFDLWRVLDYGGVMVHLMHPDAREFYGIEKLYDDAPRKAWKAGVPVAVKPKPVKPKPAKHSKRKSRSR